MQVNLKPQEGSNTGGMAIVVTEHRSAAKGVGKIVGYTKAAPNSPITFIRQNGLHASEIPVVIAAVKAQQVAEVKE